MNGAGLRVDAADLALIGFPGRVPELAIDPADAGHVAVGIDGAQDLAGVRINLVDLAVSILPDPERALGPGEPRVMATARRRNRREHLASVRVDLLDPLFRDLVEVPAIEGGSGMRGDVDRPHRLAAGRIDRIQLVTGREPDVVAVEGDAMDLLGAFEGAVLADDLGGGSGHGLASVTFCDG